MKRISIFKISLGLLLASNLATASTIDHELTVWLQPELAKVRVRDRVTLATDRRDARAVFKLNANAQIEKSPVSGLTIVDTNGHFIAYAVEISSNQSGFELEYSLKPETMKAAQFDDQGAFFSAASYWFPQVDDRLVSFSLEVEAPAGWTVVSQGRRATLQGNRVRWIEKQAQDDIYLIAGPFVEYRRDADGIQALAFLRTPDEKLAQSYLDATVRYVKLYAEMIGPYPYAKFALVENSWDSGYGMPSFTLLGPRVIRLPFIIHTSYPHEVLHNWWGNSVYIDFDSGNWSEGLTAYLADHYLREQRGTGAQYRRDALQKYRNYVSTGRDFPLSRFRSKHGEASEAVGYNKTMMFFHMLRVQLGDQAFFDGLREFYRAHQFERAGFQDIRAAMEKVSGTPLDGIFAQWVTRTGAPRLALEDAAVVAGDGKYIVTGALRQTQDAAVFALDVPVKVVLENGAVEQRRVRMDQRRVAFELAVAARPRAVRVDPDFELFRILDLAEIPPSFSESFGYKELVFVLPRGLGAARRAQYEAFIAAIDYTGGSRRVIADDQSPPAGAATWYLGAENIVAKHVFGATDGLQILADRISLDGRDYETAAISATFAARAADKPPSLWTVLHPDEDAVAMARRLRHYGRYSYLVFESGRPVARGQWPVRESPLQVTLSD